MSDQLVVVSKVKKHVKEKSGLSTSAAVMEVLSKILERELEKAIRNAKAANRKTVMDRDFDNIQGF